MRGFSEMTFENVAQIEFVPTKTLSEQIYKGQEFKGVCSYILPTKSAKNQK